jgi:hypothetical protein
MVITGELSCARLRWSLLILPLRTTLRRVTSGASDAWGRRDLQPLSSGSENF